MAVVNQYVCARNICEIGVASYTLVCSLDRTQRLQHEMRVTRMEGLFVLDSDNPTPCAVAHAAGYWLLSIERHWAWARLTKNPPRVCIFE